jgi:hypothetical protein
MPVFSVLFTDPVFVWSHFDDDIIVMPVMIVHQHHFVFMGMALTTAGKYQSCD